MEREGRIRRRIGKFCALPKICWISYSELFVRDNILAALLDGVRAAGNHDVHVKMRPTDRAMRLIPFTAILDEDAESQHAKLLYSPIGKATVLIHWRS